MGWGNMNGEWQRFAASCVVENWDGVGVVGWRRWYLAPALNLTHSRINNNPLRINAATTMRVL